MKEHDWIENRARPAVCSNCGEIQKDNNVHSECKTSAVELWKAFTKHMTQYIATH